MASGIDKYKYETDKNNIFYARTDDAAALSVVRGEEPSGATTESITFEFSKNSREVGCKPRHCILYLKGNNTVSGCLVDPKSVVKRVIVLKPTFNPIKGTEVTVNGRVWVIGSIVGEQMR